jgi:ABC-type lipoprotein export system ATPase subunit
VQSASGMKATITRSIDVVQTSRLKQMAGLFDVTPAKVSTQSWDVELQLPEKWHVGAIVGPSGAGKSTVARELFGDSLVSGWPWPDDKSILDGFPAKMSIKDITALLSSVGFSSPPYWMRPFRVLSNGQQFRVNLARTLAERSELAVVDEFTSVVDRTVAQIGSAAIAKTVRRRNQKFIAVTCHYDVIDWLEPDWVYEPHTGKFQLNAGPDGSRGSLWRRPPIQFEIVRADRAAWDLFKGHHYLSADIHRGSKCFVGLVRGQPAAFTAVLSFPHAVSPSWREHRTVCLPDYQGVGIGNAMSEYIASLFRSLKKYSSTTSHPAMIRHRVKSPLWRVVRRPGMVSMPGKTSSITGMGATASADRITASFEYVGAAQPADARAFGL